MLRPAGGASFGGDFVVSYSDGKTLEVALVDVSGKGIDAGTRALLLSGAFGGLLGSVPSTDFLAAANAYMRRGRWNEGFVTAVHLSLDLTSGEYVTSSAGHLPAVHYDAASGRWRVTQARGIVLGVVADLQPCRPAPRTACCAAATRSSCTPTGWSKHRAATSTTASTSSSVRPSGWSRPVSGPAPVTS